MDSDRPFPVGSALKSPSRRCPRKRPRAVPGFAPAQNEKRPCDAPHWCARAARAAKNQGRKEIGHGHGCLSGEKAWATAGNAISGPADRLWAEAID